MYWYDLAVMEVDEMLSTGEIGIPQHRKLLDELYLELKEYQAEHDGEEDLDEHRD